MWPRLLSPTLYHGYLRQHVVRNANTPLAHYVAKGFPSKQQKVKDTEFLALDFETTGLNKKSEAILSIGYTLIRNQRIIMAENGYHIIKINKALSKKSVAIHKITDDRTQQGEHLSTVLPLVLKKLAGRVLIAHHAPIECGFLNAACQQLYGYPLPLRTIDTLILAKRELQRRETHGFASKRLRLFNLRAHYGLPRYYAHNALEDAIATAELFLVQLKHKSNHSEELKLKSLLV